MFGDGKKVSLGGKSSRSRQGREDLVQQSRAQRAQREDVKLRNKAATTLQAAWRSHMARHVAMQLAIAQFDAIVKPTAQSVNEKRNSPTGEVYQQLHQLVTYAAMTREIKRVTVAIKLIQIIPAFNSAIEIHQFRVLWTGLLSTLVADVQSSNSPAACFANLSLLHWFAESEKWMPSPANQVLVQAHLRVLYRVIQGSRINLFQVLRNNIINWVSRTSKISF
jgi:hypothetical protein